MASTSGVDSAVPVIEEILADDVPSGIWQEYRIAFTADPALIAGKLLSGLDAQPASPHAVHAEIARAAEGFRLLRLLLTHGTLSELDSLDGLSLVPAPWTER